MTNYPTLNLTASARIFLNTRPNTLLGILFVFSLLEPYIFIGRLQSHISVFFLSRECWYLYVNYIFPTVSGNPILDGNLYTPGEPTLSNNPNVFFHRNGIHPGLMY